MFPIWVAYGVDICNYYGICHIVPICTTCIVLNDTVVYIVQVSLRKCWHVYAIDNVNHSVDLWVWHFISRPIVSAGSTHQSSIDSLWHATLIINESGYTIFLFCLYLQIHWMTFTHLIAMRCLCVYILYTSIIAWSNFEAIMHFFSTQCSLQRAPLLFWNI